MSRRVALITGATSGVGSAMCRHLAGLGIDLGIVYHTQRAAAYELADDCTQVDTVVLQADVSIALSAKNIVEGIVERLGRVDYLVNNASFSQADLWNVTPLSVSDEAWQMSLAVDLNGSWFCSRAAIPHMLRQGRGKIVNFSSMGCLQGDVDTFAYNAAKAGVISLTKGLAKAYAPNITAYTVAPGSIDSGWIEKWGVTTEEKANFRASREGLRRLGTPEEAAAIVAFLLSKDADYMTGHVFPLDGGASL